MRKTTVKKSASPKVFTFKHVERQYNRLVDMIGHEFLRSSDDTYCEFKTYSLEEMRNEIRYALSCYYEDGHCFNDMYYEGGESRAVWRREVSRLKAFLEKYRKVAS